MAIGLPLTIVLVYLYETWEPQIKPTGIVWRLRRVFRANKGEPEKEVDEIPGVVSDDFSIITSRYAKAFQNVFSSDSLTAARTSQLEIEAGLASLAIAYEDVIRPFARMNSLTVRTAIDVQRTKADWHSLSDWLERLDATKFPPRLAWETSEVYFEMRALKLAPVQDLGLRSVDDTRAEFLEKAIVSGNP